MHAQSSQLQPTQTKQSCDAVIPGTISKALTVGQTMRRAAETQSDIASAIAECASGYVAFRGSVKEFHFETKDGFTLGVIHIQGQGEYQGATYSIEVKNENMVARLNGVVDVTIPDLICILDLDQNIPVTNPHHRVGDNLAVVILPAPKEFTSEKGLAAFGPAYAGVEQDYQSAVAKHFTKLKSA
ncbi:S-methyl thiohydantoin desulfurase domain-containing protein [Paraglaciecola chathamensis]|nr:DUF917 domain-containing protein [Paraglaciecola chathamensis]